MVAGVAPFPSSCPSSKLSVLVIDDDHDIREFFDYFLSGEGFEVTTLADPTNAIDLLRDQVFHLIVLDLEMPKLTGLDLLPQIRAIDDDIPVIIITGMGMLETAAASIHHGVSAYLVHPIVPFVFRETLARIARKRRLVLRDEDEVHAAIGRQSRARRKALGLTLKQMARRANLSVSLLSQIERGESSASLSSLFKIAIALGVRLADLFGER